MMRAGYRVPAGFCVPVSACEHFLVTAGLPAVIAFELGRKPLEAMRWEEMWDAALRIRSAFLAASIPTALAEAILKAAAGLAPGGPFVVRSSAPGEDSAAGAFAGIHESVVGVEAGPALLDAVKVVWASLWSDAAILYRRELGLDASRSRMGVVVQTLATEDRSGVAFGRDPRRPDADCAIVEAVAGPCADLVDGRVDPDRWILDRSSGAIVEWRQGAGSPELIGEPLLAARDLLLLHRALVGVERLFGWAPDIEWTGRADRLILLQSRPITTGGSAVSDDRRAWYLTLRPGPKRLRALRDRVAGELIPALEAEGERLAAEDLAQCSDRDLAAVIEARRAILERWRREYEESFIPFAHGVRRLGQYYNDAVRPSDPYEFVGILRGERMLASERNSALARLANRVREDRALRDALTGPGDPDGRLCAAEALKGGQTFVEAFRDYVARFMDISYQGERLGDRPEAALGAILELARAAPGATTALGAGDSDSVAALERRMLQAVGEARHAEALEVLEIGRLSWRLRDDDNILLGRVESQLLRAVRLGADRLLSQGRIPAGTVGEWAAQEIAAGLRDARRPVALRRPPGTRTPSPAPTGEVPRQMVGQPAAPGLATGRVRRVRTAADLASFRAGEVLVCDAIQPTMTHLVPLAAAVVERRGGMLIHGAIIARELGIPCVNGIADAAEVLNDRDIVTVDGYLGIVTVGQPDFALERATWASPPGPSLQ
jgi:pyruvate,water dikinase